MWITSWGSTYWELSLIPVVVRNFVSKTENYVDTIKLKTKNPFQWLQNIIITNLQVLTYCKYHLNIHFQRAHGKDKAPIELLFFFWQVKDPLNCFLQLVYNIGSLQTYQVRSQKIKLHGKKINNHMKFLYITASKFKLLLGIPIMGTVDALINGNDEKANGYIHEKNGVERKGFSPRVDRWTHKRICSPGAPS